MITLKPVYKNNHTAFISQEQYIMSQEQYI